MSPPLALAIILIACATDALDGWLARLLDCVSEFGARLEPWADKATYWAMLGVILSADVIPVALYPVLAILVLHETVQLVLVHWVGSRVASNGHAKKRVACVMIMSVSLYISHALGDTRHAFFVSALLAGYASIYFTAKSMVTCMRELGWHAYIPRPLSYL